jgi:uncharacterized protein YdaU (DUF1376 family)
MSENPKPFAGWFDMYPERFIAGTAIMDLAERGAYITLLCHQWLAESLPADPRILARLAGGDVSPAVLDKFPVCEDGKRRNAKLERVRQEQVERMQKNKGRAQRAANARWAPDAPSNAQAILQACSKHAPSIPQAYPQAMLEPCHPHPSSLIPQSSFLEPQSRESVGAASATPAPAPKEPKAKRVRFAKPSVEEWTEYARTMPNALTENQAIGAWDHYEANGWRVGRNPMVDWQATLRRWGRNQREFSQTSRPQHKPPVSRNGSGFVMTEQQRIDLDADSLPDNI